MHRRFLLSFALSLVLPASLHARPQDPPDGLGWCVDGEADFDGDEVPDVLVGDVGLERHYLPCAWLLSGTDGSVIRRIPLSPEREWFSSCCVIADLDGDGRSDVVTSVRRVDGQGESRAWSSRTLEVLWTATTSVRGPHLRVDRIGDIDGDGVAELARSCSGRRTQLVLRDEIEILSGRTGERLTTVGIDGGSGREYQVTDVGDVDGDGVPEIALSVEAGSQASYVVVHSVARSRRLWRAMESDEVRGCGAGVLGCFDFDGDGHLDLAVSCASGFDRRVGVLTTFEPCRVRVLSAIDGKLLTTLRAPNLGDGAGFGASMALVEDLDGDRRPEIACGYPEAGLSYGAVTILASSGGAPRSVFTPNEDWHWGGTLCRAGDLDCDGADDLIVACSPHGGHYGGPVRAVNPRRERILWSRSAAELVDEVRGGARADVRADGRR